MKFKAPIITLGAGLAVAGVLYAMNVNLSNDVARTPTAASSSPGPALSSPAFSSPAPVASSPAAQQGTITYAGAVDGGAASLGIVVNNGKAIAYVCDGNTAEAWLDGSMANGEAHLNSAKGSLTGTYSNGQVKGTVTAGKKSWTFTIKAVAPPSGLYRSQAALRKKLDASWIVLPDGRQIGVQTLTDGTQQAAPPFDLNAKTATVDGTTVAIEPTTPATGY
ncbi:hypothetical protein [Dactylosporangium sp. CA-139066]|uniref:hypothetical protein n=1 Tax=Dactylosporangium sp. CA-139066 TaxID=3239930 RepID=UPI003D8F9444